MIGMPFRKFGTIAMSMAVLVMVATPADARRGGSFGSRGARTYSAPPTTATAPRQAAPMQRSMTEQRSQAFGRQGPAPASRFGGMAKGLLGGLVAGGLLGMLMGHGFGAMNGSGILMSLLQGALLGGLVLLAIRLFRRRSGFAAAGAPAAVASAAGQGASPFSGNPFVAAQQNGQQGGFAMASRPAPFSAPGGLGQGERHLEISLDDKQSFERLLTEVQDAFGREDYARLRACTTPEIMSYLAEELSMNATRGQRNEVTGTVLLEAETAEAWSEGQSDYATIAMQYESIDVMRDRTSGAVVTGDPSRPTRTTELWTFVRDASNPWRLSAIQEA